MADRIMVKEGDITLETVDAIVNAANSTLLGGGGVDGAIHKAAGPELLAACRTLGGCETGDAKITDGYDLPARHVIHTVGPVWHGGEQGEDKALASCYEKSLGLAASRGLQTVAFPAISTGVYRFPLLRATRIAVETVAAFLSSHDVPETVTFMAFGKEAKAAYKRIVAEIMAEGGRQ